MQFVSNEELKIQEKVSKRITILANIGDIVFDLLAEDNQGIQTKEVLLKLSEQEQWF